MPGPRKCWAIARSALNSRVGLEVSCEPLPEMARRIGRDGSPTVGRPERRLGADPVEQPFGGQRIVEGACGWVEISSTLTTSVSTCG
jgi:hypothetical protein